MNPLLAATVTDLKIGGHLRLVTGEEKEGCNLQAVSLKKAKEKPTAHKRRKTRLPRHGFNPKNQKTVQKRAEGTEKTPRTPHREEFHASRLDLLISFTDNVTQRHARLRGKKLLDHKEIKKEQLKSPAERSIPCPVGSSRKKGEREANEVQEH